MSASPHVALHHHFVSTTVESEEEKKKGPRAKMNPQRGKIGHSQLLEKLSQQRVSGLQASLQSPVPTAERRPAGITDSKIII